MNRIVGVVCLGAALMMTTAAFAAERPAKKAEISKIAVGNTMSGGMYYGKDGSYLFNRGSPGRYTISDGQVCVKFRAGGSRCDRIVTDGKNFTLINAGGQRYPFRPK
jgi:hypothetical protein